MKSFFAEEAATVEAKDRLRLVIDFSKFIPKSLSAWEPHLPAWLGRYLPKWMQTLRFKIMGLIAGALTVSLLSYIYVGTSLVTEDKVSYIYDYNLAQVKAAADMVDSQIQRVVTAGRLLGHIFGPGGNAAGHEALRQAFERESPKLAISGLLLLRPVTDREFATEFSFGEDAPLRLAVAEQGLTPAEFQKSEIVIGKAIRGTVPVGGRTVDAAGRPIAFLALMKPDTKALNSLGKDFELHLFGASGKVLLSSQRSIDIPVSELEKFYKSLNENKFSSGVRHEMVGGKDLIVAYQRAGGDRLTLVGMIPRSVAFAAARALATRSLALGLSILLISVGLTLLFVKGLTLRIKQMWHATLKVSQGDFSVRVDSKAGVDDEVSSLAKSFNSMADKIDELMAQTAEKARMEKELETAQVVQSRFFPSQDFEDPAIQLAGRYAPASECAGDWWHYARIGEYLLVAVGDVTGHGVSAALVTAAAHATFCRTVARQQKEAAAGVEPSLVELMSEMNAAVLAAACGEATMTFNGCFIEVKSGKLQMINASHPVPYVYQKPKEQTDASVVNMFKPLMGGQCSALGSGPEFKADPLSFQLSPGDRIFWYTDGVFEPRKKDGRKMTRTVFIKNLALISDRHGLDATKICGTLMSETMTFFGKAPNSRPDDITVVVAALPEGERTNT